MPPGALIAPPVEFTMVQPADGNCEPVADFPPHRPRLCKLDVVGIGWGSAADKTGLSGHKLQVFAVALTHGFANDGDGLLTTLLIATAVRLLMFWCDLLKFPELAQFGSEGFFERLGIRG
jgi:hypothetical protein